MHSIRIPKLSIFSLVGIWFPILFHVHVQLHVEMHHRRIGNPPSNFHHISLLIEPMGTPPILRKYPFCHPGPLFNPCTLAVSSALSLSPVALTVTKSCHSRKWWVTLTDLLRCVCPLFCRRFGGLMARNPASYVSSLPRCDETNVREWLWLMLFLRKKPERDKTFVLCFLWKTKLSGTGTRSKSNEGYRVKPPKVVEVSV